MTQSKPARRQMLISSPEGQRSAVMALMALDASQSWEVTIQSHRPKRSLNANALYWMWMTQLAKYFSKRAGPFSSDDMHDLMRHQHLGYTEPRTIGSTQIPAALISTASLSSEGFCEYMTRIDAWAADHGCCLITPQASQYADYKEART